jgi:5-methylcytosine-specific restriction endonuclease McrA
MRWRKSPKKRETDRRYYTSPKGRSTAVKRMARLKHDNEYYRSVKRLVDTAAYKRLRKEVLSEIRECQKCHRTENLTLDHIVALSIGGTHTRDNLQVLCRSCNSKKKRKVERYELPEMRK